MRSLLFRFRLHDPSVAADLLHELNLHDGIDGQSEDGQVLVRLDDLPLSIWTVRSTITLFDPGAVELRPGQDS